MITPNRLRLIGGTAFVLLGLAMTFNGDHAGWVALGFGIALIVWGLQRE